MDDVFFKTVSALAVVPVVSGILAFFYFSEVPGATLKRSLLLFTMITWLSFVGLSFAANVRASETLPVTQWGANLSLELCSQDRIWGTRYRECMAFLDFERSSGFHRFSTALGWSAIAFMLASILVIFKFGATINKPFAWEW